MAVDVGRRVASARVASALVVAVPGSALGQEAAGGDLAGSIAGAVAALSGDCWSCRVYVNLYSALLNVVAKMNAFFVETPSVLGSGVLVIGCVLMIRILAMTGTPVIASVNVNRDAQGLYVFLARVSLVFLLMTTGFAGAMAGSPFSSDHPLRLLFFDGPLMIGTEVGLRAAGIARDEFKVQVDLSTCPVQAAGGVDGSEHSQAACAILNGFHRMGIAGAGTGLWLALKAPSESGNAGFASILAIALAGLIIAGCFLWFTIVFGLRYIDALVRGMVVLAFLPIFLFFWLFDSTRAIAHAGVKSIIFMGSVFAVSGIVFVISTMIMYHGLSQAIGGGGGAEVGAAFLAGMAGGGFNDLVGTGNVTGDGQWMAFFYLLATWALSTQIARAVFSIAAEFVAFSGGLLGVAEQTEKESEQMRDKVMDTVLPGRGR